MGCLRLDDACGLLLYSVRLFDCYCIVSCYADLGWFRGYFCSCFMLLNCGVFIKCRCLSYFLLGLYDAGFGA